MGTNQQFHSENRAFSPVELSAFILKQLKYDAEVFLGEEVTEAVISVPAYFNDNQRIATKQAGQLAGLHTTRIVNEPSAAALAYQFGYDEATLMIFDFGGGTFDVSMVDCFDNIIEILSIAGDNHLGGKNVDEALAMDFCLNHDLDYFQLNPQEKNQLLRDMEVLKEKLSTVPQILYQFQGKEQLFTTAKLYEVTVPLMKQLKEIMARAVRDSEKVMSDIDAVILVGGSSNLLGIPEFIKNLMGFSPKITKNPQTVVALGMGYYVGMKSRAECVSDLILTDVCPFTLGVSVVNGTNDKNPHLSPMISRNSTLPACKKASFSTVYNKQTTIAIEVIQGEGYFVRDNLSLGKINFQIPPSPAGTESVEVTFTYDFNGILQVDIHHKNSDTSLCHKILSTEVHSYSEEELEQAIAQLNQFKLRKTSPVESHLLRKCNEYYGKLGRFEKEMLIFMMEGYHEAKEKSLVAERKFQRKLEFFLDLLAEWEEITLPFSDSPPDHFEDYLRLHLEEPYTMEDFTHHPEPRELDEDEF